MMHFDICAQAFLEGKKGYYPLIKEVTSEIKDALEEAERIFDSNESKYSKNQFLNHVSGILDELMRLAMLGPCESDRIVLFMKPKSWKDQETWKFADEIHKYMKRGSLELSTARELYQLRNRQSSHRCKPVDAEIFSSEKFELVRQYIERVLEHIESIFEVGGEE